MTTNRGYGKKVAFLHISDFVITPSSFIYKKFLDFLSLIIYEVNNKRSLWKYSVPYYM